MFDRNMVAVFVLLFFLSIVLIFAGTLLTINDLCKLRKRQREAREKRLNAEVALFDREYLGLYTSLIRQVETPEHCED